MHALVRHLFPPFDAWWPNIYAMIWSTPLTVVLVWLSHRRSITHIRTHISQEIKSHLGREAEHDQGNRPR